MEILNYVQRFILKFLLNGLLVITLVKGERNDCLISIIDVFIYCQIFSTGLGQQTEQEPEFLQPLDNLTVTQGRDVSFTCVVNNLGQYRVSILYLI